MKFQWYIIDCDQEEPVRGSNDVEEIDKLLNDERFVVLSAQHGVYFNGSRDQKDVRAFADADDEDGDGEDDNDDDNDDDDDGEGHDDSRRDLNADDDAGKEERRDAPSLPQVHATWPFPT